MATLLNLLDDLRSRLNDAGDSQVAKTEKVRYLNYGIAAMYPDVYKTIRDASITLVADDYEYDLPATFGPDARIFRVEIESATAGKYKRLDGGFTIYPGNPMSIVFDAYPGEAGKKVRLSAAVRLATLAADGDTYDGPVGTEELPVLYAMACTAGRRLDDRLDFKRYSTVAASNGVAVDTLQGSAQFWFSQFDLALAKAAMPLPVAGMF